MRRHLFWMLLLHAGAIHAQQKRTIVYVARVPLVVVTGYYLNELGDRDELFIVSPDISIFLHPVDQQVDGDEWFSPGTPLPKHLLNRVEYRVQDNGNASAWQTLDEVKSSPSHPTLKRLLTSRILQEGDSLALEFRMKGSAALIQRTMLYRKSIAPSLKGYRIKNKSDAIDNKLKASVAKRKLPEGFTPFKAQLPVLPPGQHIDLVFDRPPIDHDSSLEYRFANSKLPDSSRWQPTGHLVALDQLSGNTSYLLELRYRSQSTIATFTITTLPYWYQRKWAQCILAVMACYLVAGLPYQLYRFRIKREKQRRIRAEQQLRTVQTQLNPHFVFNSLNTIDGLLAEGSNEKAAAYLHDFSDIMRDTVKNADMVYTSLADDTSMLDRYLRIEQLRFGFAFHIILDEKLKPTEIDFPPMLLQPVVENAVKHGVAGLKAAGRIEIRYTRSGNDLVVTIADNGKGETFATDRGTGKGIAFTRERISNLNGLQKHQPALFSIESKAGGTTATFIFKNWLS